MWNVDLGLLVGLLGLCAVACNGSSSSGDGGETPASGQAALVGAWYGDGPDFPDGDQCFIFCENGRFFTGDRPCTDTTAGDFSQYLTYRVNGQNFEALAPEGLFLTGHFAVTRDTASITLRIGDAEYVFAPMTRTAPTSPLCDSSTAIWQGW
jgi:hypothetical protein